MKNLLFQNKIKSIFPIISICIILIFYIKRLIILKYYPPLCNLTIFLCFFVSLFTKETIIQKFARLAGDKLEQPALAYTRNVTYVWTFFTFCIFLISIWTIFQSDKIWLLFNGLISYILVGVLFGVEYIIRTVLRKRKLI